MYKCQLQELCQKRQWTLPTYTSSKQGLDHNPSFFATVVVNGQTFHTDNLSKSSKEAQNDAAKIAFDYLSLLLDPKAPELPIPAASSFPQPSLLSSSGSLAAITEMDTIHAIRETFEQKGDPILTWDCGRIEFPVHDAFCMFEGEASNRAMLGY
ncbi:Double-stranded RNA-binding domain containing protein [Parasponia andersonii]|uniref:Double-stranded RNA-binding domain containing protein n=1 Tax=Parasponia andersonii TaxID=3476 RepID=A0A2P5BK07_PARAD|nr:Double-stranded RNA-binding domain containing protein [Parasponia andersonii]